MKINEPIVVASLLLGSWNLTAQAALTLTVPTQAPTIQHAIVQGATTVVLEPGTYNESVSVDGTSRSQRELTIKAEHVGTVVWKGAPNTRNVFASTYTDLTLRDLSIVSKNGGTTYYSSAAVFGEFGSRIVVDNCTIQSDRHAIVGNYVWSIHVSNSKLIGPSLSDQQCAGSFKTTPNGIANFNATPGTTHVTNTSFTGFCRGIVENTSILTGD